MATDVAAMAPDTEALLVEKRGAVLRITINREGRRNALTNDVIGGIARGIQRAETDSDIGLVVLTGVGERAFCAGADLTPGTTPFNSDTTALSTPFANLLRAGHACLKPIVGRVNGACLAGGMGLLGICDIAVAADHARFGLPEVKVGIFPMQVVAVLRDLMAPRHFRELCLTGRQIDAARAMTIGLVNEVVPLAQLDNAVDATVGALLEASPMAVRRGKYSLRAMEAMSFDEMIAFAETQIGPMTMTPDAREGLAAFNERRKPIWRND